MSVYSLASICFLLLLSCALPTIDAQTYNYINVSVYNNSNCDTSGLYNDGRYFGPGECAGPAGFNFQVSYTWAIDTSQAFIVNVSNSVECLIPPTVQWRFTSDGQCQHVNSTEFGGYHFSLRRNFYHPPAPTPVPPPPTPLPTPAPTPVPTGNGNGTLQCGNNDCVQSCGTSGGGCMLSYCRSENSGGCTSACGCPGGGENGCGCCAYNPITVSCSPFVPKAPLVPGDFLSVAGIDVEGDNNGDYACRTTGQLVSEARDCPSSGYNLIGAACKHAFLPHGSLAFNRSIFQDSCGCFGGSWHPSSQQCHFQHNGTANRKCPSASNSCLGKIFGNVTAKLPMCAGWVPFLCSEISRRYGCDDISCPF